MQPPMGGGAPAPGNLASPGLRIVGGLIDLIILSIVDFVINRIINDKTFIISIIVGLVLVVGYFTYFWSQRGQSVDRLRCGRHRTSSYIDPV